MNTLGKSRNTSDMKEEIKNVELKIQEYNRQIKKNKEIIFKMVSEAEEAKKKGNINRKEELIKRIEGSIKFNQTYVKALHNSLIDLTNFKKSIKEASKLYSADRVPTRRVVRRTGGKLNKTRNTKMSSKLKQKNRNTKNKAKNSKYKTNKK